MKRAWWPFYGPNAEGTARHFHKHLDEFLAREGLEGCTTGLDFPAPGQVVAWCDAPDDTAALIARVLRARGVVDRS